MVKAIVLLPTQGMDYWHEQQITMIYIVYYIEPRSAGDRARPPCAARAALRRCVAGRSGVAAAGQGCVVAGEKAWLLSFDSIPIPDLE